MRKVVGRTGASFAAHGWIRKLPCGNDRFRRNNLSASGHSAALAFATEMSTILRTVRL